jgi:hypothetical protein
MAMRLCITEQDLAFELSALWSSVSALLVLRLVDVVDVLNRLIGKDMFQGTEIRAFCANCLICWHERCTEHSPSMLEMYEYTVAWRP